MRTERRSDSFDRVMLSSIRLPTGHFLVATFLLSQLGATGHAQEPERSGWEDAIGYLGAWQPARQGGRANLGKGGRHMTRAIERGLHWIASQQHEDGYWLDLTGTRPDVERTALSVLCFLGEGSLPKSGEFEQQVRPALAWLASHQDPDSGFLGNRTLRRSHRGHALATLALIDASWLATFNAREELPEGPLALDQLPLRLAVDRLRFLRNTGDSWPPPARGGLPTRAVQALSDLALQLHEDLESELVRRSENKPIQRPHLPGPLIVDDERWILAQMFEGALVEELTKRAAFAPAVAAIFEQADRRHDRGEEIHPARRMLQTYPLFQYGGREWKTWEKSELSPLAFTQSTSDEESGSWDPTHPGCDRLQTTALNVITLQVYYRYSRVIR